MSSETLSSPEAWLDLFGDVLYRYARARVQDRQVAEDLVQDTLLAALKARENFSGNSSEKTWLIGILKHKIVDHFRKASREPAREMSEEEVDRYTDACFNEAGHWQIEISDWSNPHTALEQEQFWKALQECVERLPPRLSRLFVMRELDGCGSAEICEVLDISTSNNLWVMLSRMRMQLRNCLDARWIDKRDN